MTDGFKIISIGARNVPRTRTQALFIADDAFLASLSLSLSLSLSRSRKSTVSRVDAPGCRPVET